MMYFFLKNFIRVSPSCFPQYSPYFVLIFPHSLERRLVEKYAELDGLRLRDYSSTHEEYIHFLEHVIKSLRNRFKSDDSSQHAEPSYSGESDDEQDNVDTELRDLYFQLKDSEVRLNEISK